LLQVEQRMRQDDRFKSLQVYYDVDPV